MLGNLRMVLQFMEVNECFDGQLYVGSSRCFFRFDFEEVGERLRQFLLFFNP